METKRPLQEQVKVSTRSALDYILKPSYLKKKKKIAREILLKKINNKYLLSIYYVSNTSVNTKAL